MVQVIAPRDTPLSEASSLVVRRTLPSRERPFVGAWCFADHYGPTEVRPGSGMDVAPHPHTGLQTVSWLFEGTIEHHDSNGVHALVRASECNLMTSGHGIAHSEESTPDTTTLHGVQLWVALPERDRDAARAFQHHAPRSVQLPGGSALVFIGELPGVDASPIITNTPLLGAELRREPNATLALRVDAAFEHGLLVCEGSASLQGEPLACDELGFVDAGTTTLTIAAGDEPLQAVLLGGEPFDDEIVMWWNFIGPDHGYVAAARDDYEAGSERFGRVEGYGGDADRIPAPPLPPGRLRARGVRR